MIKLEEPINRVNVPILEALADRYEMTNDIEVIGNHVYVANQDAYDMVDRFLTYGLNESEFIYLCRIGFMA